ncbi:MAG TPA: response regulator [Vicinamibacterales bacterium]
MTEETFLTTEEVLDYLHVNVRTIYRLIRAGKIPAVRIGRQWRFRRRDLDVWLRTVRSSGDAERRRRVLVVDDEEAVLTLFRKTFERAQYDVDTAGDGAAAIECLRANAYDLLVTDLQMPGVGGLSVIREARRLVSGLPVVIVTGRSTEASAIEAVNLGVSAYLTKPFRMGNIMAAAARALGDSEPTLPAES